MKAVVTGIKGKGYKAEWIRLQILYSLCLHDATAGY
jgi:hypothetical protein